MFVSHQRIRSNRGQGLGFEGVKDLSQENVNNLYGIIYERNAKINVEASYMCSMQSYAFL